MKRGNLFPKEYQINRKPREIKALTSLIAVGLLLVPTLSQADGYIVDQNDGSVMLTNQVNHIPKAIRHKVVRQHQQKRWTQRNNQRKLFARFSKRSNNKPKLVLKELTTRTDPVQDELERAALQTAQQKVARVTLRCKQIEQRFDASKRKQRYGKRTGHQRSYELAVRLAACKAALEDAQAVLKQGRSQDDLLSEDQDWQFASKDAQEQISMVAQRCRELESQIAKSKRRYQKSYELTVRLGACRATLENARKQLDGVEFNQDVEEDFLDEEFQFDSTPGEAYPTGIPKELFQDSTITINEL